MTLVPRLLVLCLVLTVAGGAASPAVAVEKRTVFIMAANQDMPNINRACASSSTPT